MPRERKYLRNPCAVCGEEQIGVHHHENTFRCGCEGCSRLPESQHHIIGTCRCRVCKRKGTMIKRAKVRRVS